MVNKTAKLQAERDLLRAQLNNLLARIFRDGGQEAARLGEGALAEADEIVAKLHVQADLAQADVRWFRAHMRECTSGCDACTEMLEYLS